MLHEKTGDKEHLHQADRPRVGLVGPLSRQMEHALHYRAPTCPLTESPLTDLDSAKMTGRPAYNEVGRPPILAVRPISWPICWSWFHLAMVLCKV